jgi:NADH-quinone oxidoreductase subunit E
MLSEKTKKIILELQKSYPAKRSALIPALHLAQAEIGYLPREIQNQIADLFDLKPNEVNAVVTFYDMFFEEPPGKHILHVCKNVSCMLKGADEVLSGLCAKLNIAPGETSQDGEFTIIASECLGACDKAPMLLADDKVIGPVNVNELEKILSEAVKGPGHPTPVQIEESEHA